MKKSIMIVLLLNTIYSYGQKSKTFKHIDSVVSRANNQTLFLLQDCDSIEDINGKKDYKCLRYYFNNADRKWVCKISISFNNCEEEVCFYYEQNKVIKVQKNKVINCKAEQKWSLYFNQDKEIGIIGKRDQLGENEVERAYYFLNLAFEYSHTDASHL